VLIDVLNALACPCCGEALALDGSVVHCAAGHSFDVAKEGYVNLLSGRAKASTADTPDMVRARRAFLDAGHFAPAYDAIARTAGAVVPGDVAGVYLDAGAGTGHLLATLLDAAPERRGVAIDISKHALRVAARAHPRLGAVVADTWGRLPIQSGAASLVTCVFAPRNAEEFARVLAPGGALIVVAPAADHLGELVGPLGLLEVDPRKHERLSAKLAPSFELIAETPVAYRLTLSRPDVVMAAAMGPTAAHASVEELAERAETLGEPVGVTVSINVFAYRAHDRMAVPRNLHATQEPFG
jgi:23S rRNA (guanine745-N1)-methyltransferase